ncbi:MAG: hypothetical protein R3B41_00130 [Candidatus Doudnabacteria bacterium]
MDGEWIDAGTIESYHSANLWARERAIEKLQREEKSKTELLKIHLTQHAQLMLNLTNLTHMLLRN